MDLYPHSDNCKYDFDNANGMGSAKCIRIKSVLTVNAFKRSVRIWKFCIALEKRFCDPLVHEVIVLCAAFSRSKQPELINCAEVVFVVYMQCISIAHE